MGIALALLTALAWGISDFLARLAAGRLGGRLALFGQQALGLLFIAVVFIEPSTWPSWPGNRSLAIGMGIGLLNVGSALAMYRAFEVGAVALLSPLISSYGAVTAVLALLIAQETPSAIQLVGMACVALGAMGASLVPAEGGVTRAGIGLALVSAAGYGVVFFLLRYVVADLGHFFPVLLFRIAGVGALVPLSLVQGQSLRLPAAGLALVAGNALLDTVAFVSYDAALQLTLTSIAGLVSSLFSIVTVLLARIFLNERLSRAQLGAVGLTLGGVALVAAGG